MKRRLTGIISIYFLMTGLLSPLAQRAAGGGVNDDIMTNADVIRLVRLGVAEAEIIERIRRSNPRFDTSDKAVKQLRKAGVGSGLMKELFNSQKVARTSGATGNGSAPCVQPEGRAKASTTKTDYDELPPSRFHESIKPDESSTRRLPPAPVADDRRPTGMNRPMLIGVARPLTPPLTPSEHGRCFDLGGGYDEILRVVSEGARQVRLRFTSVALHADAKLFVSSGKNGREVYGPYEGRGPSADGSFWTPPVEGDTVVVEYYNPLPASERRGRRVPFQITEVTHVH